MSAKSAMAVILKGMELYKLINNLQSIAPETLAESWDKVGLHLGDPQWDVTRVLLCIDLTEQVLAEAIAEHVGLIIAYHPPIFSPITSLTTKDWKSRMLLEAAHRHIAIYSPHTALDAAEGGVNDWLAGAFEDAIVEPITPSQSKAGGQCKVVAFIPEAELSAVRQAMANAGAGQIGNYEQCSYAIKGQGSFKGNESSNPTIGEAGKLEHVDEIRLEMVCPNRKLAAVIDALREAHSYEEPAFDIYPLTPPPTKSSTGQGRLVTLRTPMRFSTALTAIKERLDVTYLDAAEPHDLLEITRIGLCAGAGGSLLEAAGHVDLFFTGEMRHHDVLDAVANGTAIVLAGHTQTERPYLPVYRKRLVKQLGEEVSVKISEMDRAPSQIL